VAYHHQYRRERTCPECGRQHVSVQNLCHCCRRVRDRQQAAQHAQHHNVPAVRDLCQASYISLGPLNAFRAELGLRPVDREGHVAPWPVRQLPRTMAEAERKTQ
jgi:hypothetical protein